MTTTTDEIAADIFRISTFVPEIGPTGFTFNQFFVRAEEPLLFHTGPVSYTHLTQQTTFTPSRSRWGAYQ